MNKKTFTVLSFFIPFCVLFIWVCYLTYITTTAQQVIVAVHGFDPRDFLSGRYIRYQIDWDNTDCTQFDDNKCPYADFDKIIHRYYLPEQYATQIDKLFSDQILKSEPVRFDIMYAYIKGQEPITSMLLINGQEWIDYLQTQHERKK